MPQILQAFISTLASLLLAPVVLFLCLILFPFAVFTTYFAFVALSVRAALIHAQVVGALIRRWLRLEDDYTSPSAWAPKAKLEELEAYRRQYVPRRQSLVNVTSPSRLDFKPRTASEESSTTSVRTVVPIETLVSRHSSSSDTSIGSPPVSRGQSRPPSVNSSAIARDYEGIGGWYALPTSSIPGPEPGSASLEWLVTNARLELPDADAASLTRPRTPEEARRSSIGGKSHRSMTSLLRRSHERSATAGSIELIRPDETISLRSNSSRASSLLERSRSQAHLSEVENLVAGGRKIEEGKNKSMIFFGEKGSKFAFRLAGLKSLGMKKKPKGEFSSPEESAGEDAKAQIKEIENGLRGKRRKSVSYDLGGGTSTNGSGPSSVEGVETGDLSIWMKP